MVGMMYERRNWCGYYLKKKNPENKGIIGEIRRM